VVFGRDLPVVADAVAKGAVPEFTANGARPAVPKLEYSIRKSLSGVTTGWIEDVRTSDRGPLLGPKAPADINEGGTGVTMKLFGLVFAAGTTALYLLCGAVCGAAQPPQPTVSLPPEVARVLTDYEEAWRAKDEKALAALFAQDGFVLSGGMPPVRGRKQIEKRYENSGGPLVLRAFAFAIEGSVGYIIGGYTRHSGDPDIGKFTLTLKKDPDGRWMIMSDMDNSNL
jgi:ketosteroid isomerase-like protein